MNTRTLVDAPRFEDAAIPEPTTTTDTTDDTRRETRLLAAQARRLTELKTQIRALTMEKDELEDAIRATHQPGTSMNADGWTVTVSTGRKTLNQEAFTNAYPPVSHPHLYQEPKPMTMARLERELGRATLEPYTTVGKPIVSIHHD